MGLQSRTDPSAEHDSSWPLELCIHMPHTASVWPVRTPCSTLGSVTKKVMVKACFYIVQTVQYPVRWTSQSALHFFLPKQTCSFRHQLDFSGKHSSHAAITRDDYSPTPLSIARDSFIQLSRLRHRRENENAQTSKG